MSNHFHILLEVPRPPEVKPTAEAILEKLAKLTCRQDLDAARQQLQLLRQNQDAAGEARWLERYYVRMWDVSAYMKLLKQRFSLWFNLRSGRKGTLWEDRFKSVLVDGAGHALATMAAYIDLNPVRARLHQDPKDYRWSGYGEAMAGKRRARQGLQAVVTALVGHPKNLLQAVELYRMHLYNQGHEGNETRLPDGTTGRGALDHDAVLAVLAKNGRVPLADYLRCRVRYFCDGAVFGSKEFVDDLFQSQRQRFGANRQTGARRLRGLQERLYALRDLQLRVFG
jgi:REP element-mobilizing transposase RayT